MLYVLVFLILWTAYYFLLYFNKGKFSPEWISRIVAITHALIISRCIEFCMFTGPWPFHNLGETNTDCQNFVLQISAGYFIFESCWCLYMRTEGVMMLLHHTISLSAMVGSLIIQSSAAEVTITTWGSELTNPFLQICWFLRESSKYDSPFAYANDFLFIAVFFVVRIGIGTVLVYNSYMSTKTIFLMKLGGFLFYCISLVWMFQICKFARKRFRNVELMKLKHYLR